MPFYYIGGVFVALLICLVGLVTELSWMTLNYRQWSRWRQVPRIFSVVFVFDVIAQIIRKREQYRKVNDSSTIVDLFLRSMLTEDRYKHVSEVGVTRAPVLVGNMALYFIARPETAEVILCQSNVPKDELVYSSLEVCFGTGILTSNGDRHRKHRKIINYSFATGNLANNVIPVINKCSRHLLSEVRKSASQNNGVLPNLLELVGYNALDIVTESMFGDIRSSFTDQEFKSVSHAIHELHEICFERIFHVWLLSNALFDRSALGRRAHFLYDDVFVPFLKKAIEQVVKSDNNNISSKDTIGNSDLLITPLVLEHEKSPQQFDTEDILQEMLSLISSGGETVTNAICWTLLILGSHPDVQEKVVQELTDVLGEEDGDRDITMDDLKKMNYLEAVIQESYRLYPPVHFIARRLSSDTQLPLGLQGRMGECILPAGATVILSIPHINRCEDYWQDAHTFDSTLR